MHQTLHTYLVDLVGHIRDGDYSYNDTTAEWRSAFGFDPQTDGDSHAYESTSIRKGRDKHRNDADNAQGGRQHTADKDAVRDLAEA